MLELPLSLVATALSLPLVITAMRRYRVLDVSNHRSSHLGSVPRGGGLACMVGVVVGLLAGELSGNTPPWALVGLAMTLGWIGMADDVRTIPATPRLLAQVLLGMLAGLVVNGGLLWVVIGGIGLAATVNVVNFMDGINGITGLTIGLWGVTALVLSRAGENSRLMPLAAIAAGAAIGFLPANLPTARLFLGDVGSYLLGALVGVGILVGWTDGLSLAILVAPLSVYLADTSYTLVRRARRRANLLCAHREHVYQRLVSSAGLSHATVAALAAGTAGLITLSWIPGNTTLGLAVTTVLLCLYLSSVRMTRAIRRVSPVAVARSTP